ncbi:molybdenum cofactor guanylyltransferase [Fictibacillus iocasae]|uniref:Probable molybdenum cofactor guanylyltransferase n=1 Tax=Fictibacillus iocasae TaxID=2715437 RepID=A0ABW2NJX8_9BACL
MKSASTSDLTGIILAGGLSSRFGSPKAFARYKNQLFYEHARNALCPFVRETVIVSSVDLLPRFSREVKVDVIRDAKEHEGKGPLAGIFSVMKDFVNTWYMVLPCDMPLMNSHAIEKIVSFRRGEIDAVIPKINGRIQPLAGLYKRSLLDKIDCQLNSGDYRMMDLLSQVTVKWVTEIDLDLSPDVFQNVNDQEALNRLSSR